MDDPLGDTKSVDDMVFDEFDYVSDFNLNEFCSFRLLWEVIDYCKDESMSFYR